MLRRAALWIFLIESFTYYRGLQVMEAQAFAQSPFTASSQESLLSTSCYNWIAHLLLAGAAFRQQGAA